MTPAVTPQPQQTMQPPAGAQPPQAQPATQPPSQMTTLDFAQKIKTKYPQYKDIPDAELSQKILDKHPQYRSQVIPDKRPESSEGFKWAQQAGGYSEPAEKSGKPIKYLVQKQGESYPDFMKRAVEYGKTVTAEQIQDEAKQPKKAASALARGPEYGALGAGVLAGSAEAVSALGTGLKTLLPVGVAGAKALAQWVEKNPMKAYMLYQLAKEVVPGVKKTSEFIKKAPTE